MLRNYFKIAWRNLKRNKFYSLINILGLALGMTCFVFIFLFITDELSYDQFHSKKDRIYRVCEKLDMEEGQGENSSSQPFPVGPTLAQDFSHLVEKSCRFFNFQEASHTLHYKDIKINEKKTFFADSTIFQIFDFPLLEGDVNKALSQVNSIVLTKDLARKYFGNENPIGKIIKYDGKLDLMVSGIFEEIPAQSHIHFDCLISFSSLKSLLGPNIGSKNWVWNPCWTYILLNEKASADELTKLFPDFIKKYFPDFIVPQATLYLQKLTDIHLNSHLDYELEPNSQRSTIYIFGAIGVFIVLIAAINYMNLATARSARRSREVGVRKVFGSNRRHLVQQFLGESVLISLTGLCFALVFSAAFLSLFNAVAGKEIEYQKLFDPIFVIGLFGLSVVIGLLAGVYPALYLSAFEPTRVLKGVFSPGRSSKLFRQALVVVQFTISIALIIGTAVIYKQLNYLQNADLGFEKEQVVVLPVRPPMAKVYIPFSEELKSSGRVLNVATMNDMLGVSHNTHEYNYEGMPASKEWVYFPSLIVSPEFVQTLDIKLVAGRSFDKNIKTDDSLAVIINEAMVKHLGWGSAENALGKQFFTPQGKERVIGVARNFNFVSLQERVGPFVLNLPDKGGRIFWTKYIVIRLPQGNVKQTLAFIEAKWNEFSKEYPFEYFFLDDNINKTYRAQDNLGKLVGYFAVLAIFIACLGLFALASFTAEQRTREIAIRKVLGARVFVILKLMWKEFVWLVLISIVVAWPLIYLIMNEWLQGFAYRVSPGFLVFVVAGVITLLIALSTVAFHGLRAAASNPVKALKYE